MYFEGKNSFTNNYAENSGGAVKWDDVEPWRVEDSHFDNNSAYLYGDDIGSFAQRILAINSSVYHNQIALVSNGKRRLRNL